MDKHRKAVIELIAAIELAEKPKDSPSWQIIHNIVKDIKASFNHSMQFLYEQHLSREKDFRAANKPEGVAKT